jgi:hypothetical protein
MMPLGGATGDAFSLGSMLVPAALTAWVLLDG